MSIVSRRAAVVVSAEPPSIVGAEFAPCNGVLPCVASTFATYQVAYVLVERATRGWPAA